MMAQLKKVLAARGKLHVEEPGRVPAAVLVPVYEDGGGYHIVFIRRTQMVKTHKGQISFPGGARESCDRTLQDTAIRESAEEIGLQPDDVEVLGELDDELTATSNYVVTPFVAAMPWPYRFAINAGEVDEIITVPVRSLLEKGCLVPATELLDDAVVDSYAYRYGGLLIWGATARILYGLLSVIAAIPGRTL
jgi:8-oxo-dGTP pyrophosphatase MutT (NUDIX family)